MAELREVGERLRELDVLLPSAREIRELKFRQAASLPEADPTRSISVTRVQNGRANVLAATDSTPLEPGDIIEVKQLLPRQFQQSAPASETRTGAVAPEPPIGSIAR